MLNEQSCYELLTINYQLLTINYKLIHDVNRGE